MHHDHRDHGCARVRPILIILAQTPGPPPPAARPLHAPSFGQDDEALDLLGTLDDLQAHLPIAAQQRYPGLQHTGVRAIGPDTAQARTPLSQDVPHACGAVTIWDARGSHPHGAEHPQRVDQRVTLAPFALLGAITPVGSTTIGRVDGLGANKRRTGLLGASCGDAEVLATQR
jgi:hypothetical protein